MMKFELVVEKKHFENDNKEKIRYYECSTNIEGQKVVLRVDKQDKKFLNYILDKTYKD